ncbi:MAG: (d)CMP kinase [Actinobacteria bacterium]|nr:MAG: (d)CMP kinase [Actinomycetota bacterium]
MIIAIDGPAASGKSTVAREVAKRLHFDYLDTGAMYRAVTWQALEQKVDVFDEAALKALARRIPIRFERSPGSEIDDRVFVGETDVTSAIRSPKVSSMVSLVARAAGVRRVMVERQRVLADEKDSVVEGRDIGTVVFPYAEVKVFLTASAGERARRRSMEMQEEGHCVNVQSLERELISRDMVDSQRRSGPLMRACDARILNTTDKSVDEVVDEIVRLYEEE